MASLLACCLLLLANVRVLAQIIRGVNIGSTFIPEMWMVPSFYKGTRARSLCQIVQENFTLAEERMRRHLETFITESDFKMVAELGLNAVRVPLGYWNVIGSAFGTRYVPNVEDSLTVLDNIFEWADTHDLSVLLDLHGAPGSQNGEHHSGCEGAMGWTSPGAFQASIDTIDALARRYGQHRRLLGFELLNEPSWKLEWQHGLLYNYYTLALRAVRMYSADALVVFNVLYWEDSPAGFGSWWRGQMRDPGVVLDLHLYDCFGNASQRSLAEHLEQTAIWKAAIERFQAHGHRVMVGEWSLATGRYPGGQAWASAQLDAFSSSLGWFYWSLKKVRLRAHDAW